MADKKLSRATIKAGDTTLVFPVNPYSAQWGYQENVVSTDTIGGRVVQLLSVQITGLSVTSVAGSRAELQKVAERVRGIMDYQIRSLRPASFRVPSRAWDFRVYLTAMPQAGWDVASTTYPYQLEMMIDEDISGVQQRKLETAALDRLFKGVGYEKSFHGGDAKGFDKIVKTVLKASALNYATVGRNEEEGQGDNSAPPVGDTTDAIKEIWDATHRQFSRVGGDGIYSCRPVAGSSTYSQHSWSNAWDITGPRGLFSEGSVPPGEVAFMDAVAKWLVANTAPKGMKLPIAQVIWEGRELLSGSTNVSDHYNHVHVSGAPMFSGTPPCNG